MKKIFMIAVMAIVALTANAQKGEYYVTPHVNVGYVNVSNIDIYNILTKETTSLSGGVGAGIGVDFEYMLADKFGVSAGVDYLYSKSSEYTFAVGNQSQKVYYTWSFVNIPILAQYHMGGFAIKAGIQPGFNAGSKLNGEYNDNGDIDISSLKLDMNNFQFSIPVGVSYTFKAPVTLDLRYTIPVTKVNKNSQEKDNRLSSILLSVGYRF